MKVDHLSLSTTPVHLFKGNDLVSQGTGFYYVGQFDKDHVLFLVTNYHVLTGASPSEGKTPIGDHVSFQLHQSEEETGKTKTVQFPLFTKTGRPVWITNPDFPEADMALIPIVQPLCQDCKVFGISEQWATPKMLIRPATTVTLVGYPYGYYDIKNALPIWKTGTVASEPAIDFDGKPLLLVDVSAFPGMSGSPVFAIASGIYEKADGSAVTPGSVREFLGIYASMQMVGKDKFLEQIAHSAKLGIRDYESLEIGHVWKAKLVIDTAKKIDIGRYESEILKDLQGKA